MSTFPSDPATADEQAALWLVRVASADVCDQDIIDLTNWLEASETHRLAFDRAEAAWLMADTLASPVTVSVPPAPVDLATRRQARVKPAIPAIWATVAAMAASLTLLLLVPKLLLPSATTTVYQTQKGENQRVTLADGTRLHLNTDSRITVHLSKAARDIVLERGELALDVVHDPRRPLTVTAGDQQLRDVGTQFDVRRTATHVTLTVSEGAVQIASAVGQPVLKAGDHASIDAATGKVDRTKADTQSAYAWQNGQAIYRDQSLAEVVADLNRYLQKPLVVDPKTGQLRLTAVINLDSESSVVQRLQAFLPISATTTDTAIILQRRP